MVFQMLLFLFNQKTEYEMRISDCSSDVCSSDLQEAVGHRPADQFGDHGCTSSFSSRSISRPSSVSRTPTRTESPSLTSAFSAGSEIGSASSRERMCQY